MKIINSMGPVPRGWENLAKQLHRELMAADPDYELVEITQKFGQLRVYANGLPVIQGIIDKYETSSGGICSHCGDTGETEQEWGKFTTYCDPCREKITGRKKKGKREHKQRDEEEY